MTSSRRRLRSEISNVGPTPTPGEESGILDRRQAIRRRIKAYSKYQRQYFTNYDALLAADEEERRQECLPSPEPELTVVYVPSNSPGHAGELVCSHEVRLREAQCTDVMVVLRNRLLAIRQFLNVRNKFISGQVARTRAQKLIDTLHRKIVDLAIKYRECFQSYVWLVGEEAALPLRRLEKENIRVFNVEEADSEAIKNLNRLDGRDPRSTASRRKVASRRPADNRRDPPGESKSTPNWVWFGGGIPSLKDNQLMHKSKSLFMQQS